MNRTNPSLIFTLTLIALLDTVMCVAIILKVFEFWVCAVIGCARLGKITICTKWVSSVVELVSHCLIPTVKEEDEQETESNGDDCGVPFQPGHGCKIWK
jgi:hypothetical protein